MMQKLFLLISRIGSDSNDTDDMRLQKNLLVLASFMFIVAGAMWGLMYMAFGEIIAGGIPFGYALFSSLSVLTFAITRQYRFFRFSQLLLILLLPLLLQIALGGFINSSGVVLWSFKCQIGALLFDEPRTAPRWFGGFIGWWSSAACYNLLCV